MRALARFDAALDARGGVRAVALLRIAAGPLVLVHLRPFLDLAAEGATWSDRFHLPYADWYPAVGGDAYVVLLRIAAVAAVMLSLGALTRIAAATTAGIVAWNLFLSVTHFHHNRAFLVVLLAGLALLPSGRHYSVDAVVARRLGRPHPLPARLWPLWLLRFEAVVVYGASGISKVADGDWWSGLVLRLRVEQWAGHAAGRGAPEWALDLLTSEAFMWWFAKVVVLTEVLIAAGLVWRRTRLGAVWVAVWFHLVVEVVAEVQVFSWAALAALVIWVTPAERDRRLVLTPSVSRGALVLSWVVPRLDWTGRFEVELRGGPGGPAVCLFDRPGPGGRLVTRVGAGAAAEVLSRLPLTFLAAAPLLLPGTRQVWSRVAGAWFESRDR